MKNYNKIRSVLKAQQGLQAPSITMPAGYDTSSLLAKDTSGIKSAMDRQTAMNNLGGNMKIAGGIADGLRNFMGVQQKSETTAMINQGYDAVANAAMCFTPIGTIIGGAMKVGGLVGDALTAAGLGTDQMTVTDQILDSNFFKLSPIGIANAALAKSSRTFQKDQETTEQIGGSYGGSVSKIDNALSKAGKKYGLFSGRARRKANKQIAEAERQQNIMADIAEDQRDRTDAAASMTQLRSLSYQHNLNGGIDYNYMRAAKLGTKIELVKSRNLSKHIINTDTKQVEEFKEGGVLLNLDWKPEIIEEEIILNLDWKPTVDEFKQGGKTKQGLETPEIEETTQKNVIPEGALHKNKHHIKHTEGLTQKGIPVVDNEGEQQAEIEHSEIIFTLEVTKKLEELYEDYYDDEHSQKEKDEAAIEAGKLLVYQILFNTDDRTSLIDKIQI